MSGAAPLRVSHGEQGGAVVLVVEGEVDLATVAEFERHLLSVLEPNRSVIVDLRKIEYLGSSGLYVLVRCDRAYRERKAALIIVGSDNVQRLIHVANLERTLWLASSVESALAS